MNPIRFDAVYDIERSRLTTFFRLFIVIPWAIWATIYGIAAFFVVIVAWFALLFTARYPQGMYNFVAGYLRLSTRVYAYALLLTDDLPSSDAGPEPEYPVRIDVAAPQEHYNRAKTFFKYVRSNGFLLLLTEAHPRLLDVPRYDPPPDAPGMPS